MAPNMNYSLGQNKPEGNGNEGVLHIFQLPGLEPHYTQGTQSLVFLNTIDLQSQPSSAFKIKRVGCLYEIKPHIEWLVGWSLTDCLVWTLLFLTLGRVDISQVEQKKKKKKTIKKQQT